MEYTIKKIANLSGVSARTLRFYDEIDLLKPARVNSSGYRIYGQNEVNRLQQILFYREMDLKLEEIKEILDNPDFDVEQALMEHQEKLMAKRQEIDRLLASVQQTMKYYKGEIEMSDQEKFTAFKEQKVAETFMEVFTKDQIPAYDVVSKDFSDTLKTNVNEKACKDLSKQIKEQYGNVKEVKFYNFQRFDQGDRVTYVAAFDKEQAVAIMLAFDKDKKLTDYVFTPLQVEEASK